MKKWKCVLTLVVLFHLCHSVTISIALSKELLRGLGTLNNLYRFNKLKFTSPETAKMRVPTIKMDKNASACVGVFVRELKHILDSVMVPENSSYVLYGLMANLEEVGKHKENAQECPMIQIQSQRPFAAYMSFLRVLNKLLNFQE